jgi:UDP-galactopyranose mutase
MIPYNQKLWAVDLKEMTDAWIKDRVMTPPLNDVIEGDLSRKKKGYGPNSVFWYPQKGGIEYMPTGFLRHLNKTDIFFNTKAVKILWREKKVVCRDGKDWQYDQLLSSLPLPLLIKALEPEIDPILQDAAGKLAYNTVYAVNLAVQRQDISPYHWVYFPEDKYLLHRISYPGNFSASMVPDGWSSITVEVSGSPSRQVPSGGKLVERVIADLRDAKVLLAGEQVEVISTLTLKPAYVIYNHDHRKSVDSLHAFLKENNIYSCGRFGEWEYLNMDQSILSGKKAVEESFSRLNTA